VASSRILITADLHLSDNPRDVHRHAFARSLPDLAKGLKANAVFILGDLTDHKDRHPARLVNHVVRHIKRVADVAPVVILMGNHDYVDADSPFFAFLRSVAGVAYVRAPREAEHVSGAPLSMNAGALFLPHTRDPDRAWADLRVKERPLIFMHQAVAGADTGFGHQVDGVPIETFNANGYVISGDIHVPQYMAPCVEYVGAPYRMNFGDEYDPRIFLMCIDGKGTFTLESIAVDGPRKQLIDCKLGHLPSVTGFNKGDLVKVRVRVPNKKKDQFRQFRQHIEDWAAKNGYILHGVLPMFEKGSIGSGSASVRTDAQLVEAYAKARGVDDKTLDVGKKLLEGGGHDDDPRLP
jgi:DNA repair exonuclease SbcCD nuclease subunit